MLDEMAVLHQAAWQARGKPGSFAQPFFSRFHHALIRMAVPRGEVALLRMSVNGTVIGILYNFVFRGRMSAYQSGFVYRPGDRASRPGLTCHHAAIRGAMAEGADIYDFLAGEDRYKRSLSDAEHRQTWAEAGPIWSPRLLIRRAVEKFAACRPIDVRS
jgi:CelD/BcsL family acetyltransferase involved in cellulose biosynthesis